MATNPSDSSIFEAIETATAEKVFSGLEEIRPGIEITNNLSTTTIQGLASAHETGLLKAQQHIAKYEHELREPLQPYRTALAGLGAFVANAGSLAGRVYVIKVPDVRDAFKEQSEELVSILKDLNVPFADVIPLQPFAEKDAENFISKLGTEIHGTLWMSLTNYASADQLAQIAPALVGTQEAGNVHLTAGKGVFRGIENVPIAPAVAGLRKRIDPMLGQKMYGCLEPLFARKGPKNFVGFDDIDSLRWSQDVAMALAQTNGINAIIYNPLSNVSTLALDRSRSNLEKRRQATGNRAAQMLIGCIRQHLMIELPSTYQDEEEIREKVRKTKEKFFKYLDRTPGFQADLSSFDGVDPSNLQLNLKYRIASPIESFSVHVEAE